MSNVSLFKNFTAGGAIPTARIVRISAAETVVLATAATDNLVGVTSDVSVVLGERCDVGMVGIAFVEAGAAVALGALVTSDASGRAVTAAPAAGANARVIGVALEAAVAAGDVIRVLISPSSIQG